MMKSYFKLSVLFAAAATVCLVGCLKNEDAAERTSECVSLPGADNITGAIAGSVGTESATVAPNGVSVVIDDSIKIMTSEVDQTADKILNSISSRMPDGYIPTPEQKAQVRDGAITQIVFQKLFERECDKEDIQVTEAEALEFIKENFGPEKKAFAAVAESLGWSEDELNERVRLDIRLNKLFEKKAKPVEVTDAEVKERFDSVIAQHPEIATNPPSVVASHILVKVGKDEDDTAAKKKIDALYEQAIGGADFGKLAEENSDCPSGKASKGSLGRFSKGRMVKEFEDAAFSQEVGKVGKPVRTQFGWHIILVESREEGSPLVFEDVKDEIKKAMVMEAAENARKKYLSELWKNSKIEILEKAVVSEAVPVASSAAGLLQNDKPSAEVPDNEDSSAEAVEAAEAAVTEAPEAEVPATAEVPDDEDSSVKAAEAAEAAVTEAPEAEVPATAEVPDNEDSSAEAAEISVGDNTQETGLQPEETQTEK